MKIIFYGQLGLPPLSHKDHTTAENRVEALARHLAEERHAVTVLGTAPFVSSGNYYGIELKRLPSLNPQKPGGWFYLGLGLVYLLWTQPDVVHVHTWRAAWLLSFCSWFLRDTRFVWTIDSIPLQPSKITKWFLRTTSYQLPATLTTPLRSLQYRLLVEYGLKATYIPDGYHQPAIAPIRAARFGLRAEQYCVALVGSPAAARFVAKAYKAAKTRKKLVIIGLKEGQAKRLKKRFPFLYNLQPITYYLTSRLRRSLIAQAATVIVGDDSVSSTVLLEAMHYQRSIIATNEPRYQEILGTAGHYIARHDEKGLTSTLKNSLTASATTTKQGQAASTRAQHHFTWPRVLEDYEILYAPQVRAILLDSVQARLPAEQAGPRVQYS